MPEVCRAEEIEQTWEKHRSTNSTGVFEAIEENISWRAAKR
jgi:hypothetical protein